MFKIKKLMLSMVFSLPILLILNSREMPLNWRFFNYSLVIIAVMLTVEIYYCRKELKEKQKKWQEKKAREDSLSASESEQAPP
jgi:hypothetical protein